MKVAFYLRDENDVRLEKNGRAIYPSKSFSQELKQQVLNNIIEDIELSFPSKSIMVENSNPMRWSLEENVWIGSFKDISVFFVKTFTLFTFDIYWKSNVNNNKIHPVDNVGNGEILFWAERVPARHILQKKSINFKSEIDYFVNKIGKKIKKYKFIFDLKSIGEVSTLSIHSVESLITIDDFLSEAIGEWNTNQKKGLVHNYQYNGYKSTNRIKTFVINWGSSDYSVLDFILSKLDKSDISIEKVILDSL